MEQILLYIIQLILLQCSPNILDKMTMCGKASWYNLGQQQLNPRERQHYASKTCEIRKWIFLLMPSPYLCPYMDYFLEYFFGINCRDSIFKLTSGACLLGLQLRCLVSANQFSHGLQVWTNLSAPQHVFRSHPFGAKLVIVLFLVLQGCHNVTCVNITCYCILFVFVDHHWYNVYIWHKLRTMMNIVFVFWLWVATGVTCVHACVNVCVLNTLYLSPPRLLGGWQEL